MTDQKDLNYDSKYFPVHQYSQGNAKLHLMDDRKEEK